MNNAELHVNPGTMSQTPPPDMDIYHVEQALLHLEADEELPEAARAFKRLKERLSTPSVLEVKHMPTTGANYDQLIREFTEQIAPEATLKRWQEVVMTWADLKGWNDKPITDEKGVVRPEFLGEQLMLVCTELAEAQEDNRNNRMSTYLEEGTGKPCGFPSELADTIIRIFHLAGRLGINLNYEVGLKMAYNYTRTKRHGGLRS
jgi:hypothetical protein